MCIICADLIRQKLTLFEASKNIGEMNTSIKKDDDIGELVHRFRLEKALKDMDFDAIDKELRKDIDFSKNK